MSKDYYETLGVSKINNSDITNLDISYKQSIVIGLTQGVACIPGISRSGSTIAIARMIGVGDSARYSFLISIPIIIASATYESFKLFSSQITVNWLGIFIVMISSFIFGILSIKIMLKILKRNKLYYFSIYLIILSLCVLLFV